jgi:hypothetical protein
MNGILRQSVFGGPRLVSKLRVIAARVKSLSFFVSYERGDTKKDKQEQSYSLAGFRGHLLR